MKKNILTLLLIACGSVVYNSAATVYEQLQFKQHNPNGFLVYSKPAPADWKEVIIKDNHKLALATADEQQNGLIFYQRPATEPVYPHSFPASQERVKQLTAFAARGEIEPLTISVYALKSIKNLTVAITPLKFVDAVIERSTIEAKIVTYWNTRYPRYTTQKRYIYTPELLMPVAPLTFSAGFSFRYWFIIHTPKDAVPGLYHGSLTFKIDNKTIVKLPISYRVLPITLLKDPNKHFSAYADGKNIAYERQQFAQDFIKNPKRFKALRLNEYRKMKEYGFDIYPSINVKYQAHPDKMVIDVDELKLMKQAGLQGPVFIYAGDAVNAFHRVFFGNYYGSHVRNLQINDKFIKTLQLMIVDLEKIRKANGFPVFIYGLLDEVAPKSAEKAAKIYAAIKELGVPTQTTKDFNAADSVPYHKYVDYWCSGGFSLSYDKATTAKHHKFWCYPNDIAGQNKDALIMGKGGRFTYGFGFWRSGFTTLIPWHWRWMLGDPFDYCNSSQGGTGNRIAPDGTFLPTYYWENFREGYDDGRYIYTLEQLISERQGSNSPQCQNAVKGATAYLQTIWNKIPNNEKYIYGNSWLGERFNQTRWRLAQYIIELQKYPVLKTVIAPSVIIKTNQQLATPTTASNKIVSTVKLDKLSNWQNITREGKLSHSTKVKHHGKQVAKWQVTIDKKHDGGGEDGIYRIGWPRIRYEFKAGEIDLNNYEQFTLWLYIDSDRDAVQAEQTRFYYDFIFAGKAEKSIKLQGALTKTISERKWSKITINLKKAFAGRTVDLRKLEAIQLWIGEEEYPDKVTVKFYLDNISLVGFKQPVIHSVAYLPEISLDSKNYPVKYTLFGIAQTSQGDYQIVGKLISKTGKTIARTQQDAKVGNCLIFKLDRLSAPGDYKLLLMVKDKSGRKIDQQQKTITVTPGIIRKGGARH